MHILHVSISTCHNPNSQGYQAAYETSSVEKSTVGNATESITVWQISLTVADSD